MKLRSLMALIVILAFLGVVAFVAVFERDWWMPWFKQGERVAKGYNPAKTPEEALDKFRQAVRERDYETAATYCAGDYADLLRKTAPAARDLARAIDNLVDNLDQEGIKSDKSKIVLKALEPFPRDVRFLEVKKAGEDRATAILVEDFGSLRPADFKSEQWKVDLTVFRALAPANVLALGRQVPVELQRQGEADKKYWVILLPVTLADRANADRLIDKYKNYVHTLEQIKLEVKNEPTTKSDIERRLRSGLEEAKD